MPTLTQRCQWPDHALNGRGVPVEECVQAEVGHLRRFERAERVVDEDQGGPRLGQLCFEPRQLLLAEAAALLAVIGMNHLPGSMTWESAMTPMRKVSDGGVPCQMAGRARPAALR